MDCVCGLCVWAVCVCICEERYLMVLYCQTGCTLLCYVHVFVFCTSSTGRLPHALFSVVL